jgi:hypothetical protein
MGWYHTRDRTTCRVGCTIFRSYRRLQTREETTMGPTDDEEFPRVAGGSRLISGPRRIGHGGEDFVEVR